MKKIALGTLLVASTLTLTFTGCGSSSVSIVDDRPTKPTLYEDVQSPGKVQGTGIESQDIVSMTDKMVRDILSTPEVVSRSVAPRIIIDSQYFKNESSSRINKEMITRRLKTSLSRSSRGRLVFINRASAAMIEKERELKRTGRLSEGALGSVKSAPYGADYRLEGIITSQDKISQTGMRSKYHLIDFVLVDLETGVEIWSNFYEFQKSSTEDIIYR